MAIAGIDIGTTGCKCTVYDDDGAFINEAYREYSCINVQGEHEIDGDLVWQKVKDVIREASMGITSIKAMGVSSFGESAILTDATGEPMLYSMLYIDPRGEVQCDELKRKISIERLNKITGLNPHPMYSISKLMWVKQNRPLVYQQTEHIFLFEDFIVFKLTGVAQIDYSLASRTMAFDINTLTWSNEIFVAAGIDVQKMSKVVPAGTIAGTVTKEVANELGISSSIWVVTGCHDQVAAAVGTGVLREGMAVDGTGTVECITPVFKGIPEGSSLYHGSYAIVPHVIPDRYVTYAFSFTGGALLKWYRDHIAYLDAQVARDNQQDPYDAFNKAVSESNPSGLLVLPHFAGAATPYMDPSSRGAIIGLTTETTSIELYRALMEGVTYEMLLNMEALEKADIQIEELRATGGGANSSIWLQMKADILNKKIVSLGAAQSGTLGSIMLAGVACGIYKDLEEAETVFVKIKASYEPDPQMHEKYMKYYMKYKKLYKAVKSVIDQ